MALNNEIQKIERAIDKVKAVNNELLNKKKKSFRWNNVAKKY